MRRQTLPWQWENFKNRGYAELGGIILNRRDVPREAEKVAELADDFHTAVIGTLSHSEQVALAEEQGMTLMECYPDSAMAGEYRALAKQMYTICGGILPESAKSDMTKKKDTAEVQNGYGKKTKRCHRKIRAKTQSIRLCRRKTRCCSV